MARPLRIEYPGAFYHVLNRGQRQEAIVADRRDHERFLSDLGRMAQRYSVLIHSYCLMTNHFHLLVETPEGNLSRAMHWLHVSYATYYNRRHACAGHLFQGRFKALLVDAGTYLEASSRYIHRNPVRAGIASRPWTYPWSSCRYFVTADAAPQWLETDRILGGFARTTQVARRRYAAYVSDTAAPNPFDEAAAGTVLGSQAFLDWVKNTFLSDRPVEHDIPELTHLKPRPDVGAIVATVAAYYRLSPEHLLARDRKGNQERDVAIYLARELSGLTGTELGRYFGAVTGAAITMRCSHIRRRMAKDRRFAREIARLHKNITNS